jgi:hypothetical protein
VADEVVLAVVIGGPYDGREFKVSADQLRYGRLEIPEGRRVAVKDYDSQPGLGLTEASKAVLYDAVTYYWDGTVREDGARRFRREKPHG